MATKQVVGIDLGRESLKCAVLAIDKAGVRVESCRTAYVDVPAEADAAAWRAKAQGIIQEWRKEPSIAKATVVVTAPTAHTLMRSLKIPTATLQQQLPIEAKQQLPFPLEELDWDYAVVGTDGDQSQISLAAIKKDITADTLALLAECGVEPAAIDSGSMALGNLLIHAQGGTCAKVTAILSLGATATNLIIVNGTKIWVRTIPVTGASIVTSVAKVLDKPEAEARRTMFSTINVARPDAEADPATKNVQVALNRVVMEITRSLTFYRSQMGGERPEQMLVTGGYSTIPGLPAFLTEKLKMNVTPFAACACVPGGEAIDAHLCGEAVGAALALAGRTACAINLLPKQIQWQQDFDRRKPLVLAAGYALAAAFIILFAVARVRKGAFERAAGTAEERLSTVQQYHSKIEDVRKGVNAQLKEDEGLRQILWERDLYANTLVQLAAILPSNVWLSGVKTVPFKEIYDQERTAASEHDMSIAEITDEAVLNRPVRLLVSGGSSGNWSEQMPALQEQVKKIPGLTGFLQRGLKKFKQYSTFDLDVELDWDRNGIADANDIKAAYAAQQPARKGKQQQQQQQQQPQQQQQ